MDLLGWIMRLSVLLAIVTAQNIVISMPHSQSCTTIAGEVGVCVYQYQCLDGVINELGDNIIDVRRVYDDDCGGYMRECCRDPAVSGGTPNVTDATDSESVRPPSDTDDGNFSEQTPSASAKPTVSGATSTTRPPLRPPPPALPEYDLEGCGHRNPNGVVFTIVNNVHSETEYGELPWTVALFVREEKNGTLKYLCGGALIDQSAILTTASCLHVHRVKPAQLVVRVGEWDMSTADEPLPHVDVAAERVHVHPQYGLTSSINDIAVVILSETVELGHTVGVVCLPPADDVLSSGDLVGTGWGNVPSFVTPKKLPQTILKKAHLRPISHDECQSTMRRLIGRKFTLHRSFLCATALDTEMLPCRGDSGSPYAVEIVGSSNRFYLAGLSTWGFDCNKQRAPTVLTNVAYHRAWIDEVMQKENFNAWSYTYQPDNEEPEDD